MTNYKPLFYSAMAGQVLLLGVVVVGTRQQKRQHKKNQQIVTNVVSAGADLINSYNKAIENQDLSGVDKLDEIRDSLEFFRIAIDHDLNLTETINNQENPK